MLIKSYSYNIQAKYKRLLKIFIIYYQSKQKLEGKEIKYERKT